MADEPKPVPGLDTASADDANPKPQDDPLAPSHQHIDPDGQAGGFEEPGED
jgi:hypothetical protein